MAHNKAEQSKAAIEREPREREKQGEANNSKAKTQRRKPTTVSGESVSENQRISQ